MTDSIKPTTIVGIKRLAKALSRSGNLSHSTALDRAASAAGFSNYTHAKRSLDGATPVEMQDAPKFRTYISIPDVDERTGKAVTYVLTVDLPRPIDGFLVPKDFGKEGFFRGYSRKASDHIAFRPNRYRGEAGEELCDAARHLQFRALTGLRQCQAWDVEGSIRSLPGTDHGSTWFDPTTNGGVFVDEPYRDYAEHDRQQWADENGYEMRFTDTWGLYKPGRCRMYLFSRLSDGLQLAPIMAALEKAGFPVTQHNWNVHAVSGSRFVSPQQIADRAVAKAARPA
jgi:hypothetical protein